MAELATLFDAHARELLGYLRTMLFREELAEDALQTVFVRLAEKGAGLEKVANRRAYLYAMARNEALRLLAGERQRQAAARASSDRPLIEPDAPLETAIRREQFSRLEAALRQLPEAQREVVMLKCTQGFTFAEIAELTGVSPDTAASRHRYGLEKLRQLLEAESREN